MATWSTIKDFLKTQGLDFIDNGESIVTGFQFEGGRGQSLAIFHTPNDEFDVITFVSPISKFNPADIERLLVGAFGSPFGIAIQETEDEKLFVIQTGVPIKDIDSSEIAYYLAAVPQYADLLEQKLFDKDSF